jgi:pimeloyl-ACP methyl ester carboxylesterase
MRPDPTGSRFEAAVPGGAIVAQRAGVGDPALLLHGGPGMSEYLDELAGELRRARLSTVRFQQRGVAPSTLAGPFDVARQVADAIAVLDVAGIERAWLIGHSWGGYLALQIASRHPERALGILAIGSLGAVGDGGAGSLGRNLLARVSEQAATEYAAIEAREEAGEATDAESLYGFSLLWPAYFADPAAAAPMPDDLTLSVACNTQAAASIPADADRLAEALAGCTVPTVFVHGDRDPLDLDASARATAAVMPNAQLVTVPGVGHFPWLERPGCVADALIELVALSI